MMDTPKPDGRFEYPARDIVDAGLLELVRLGPGCHSRQALDPRGTDRRRHSAGMGHAEYIKLVRSIADQHVFDVIPPVRARYAGGSLRDRIPWKYGAGSDPFGRSSPLRFMLALAESHLEAGDATVDIV